jgi:hypothetical protein
LSITRPSLSSSATVSLGLIHSRQGTAMSPAFQVLPWSSL